MNYRELTNLGLNEKEAKIYLAALELGKSPVQKISQKAGINRATAYVIIEALSKKGLMSSYTEGKKQFFVSESPEKLNLLFREQVMEIQRKQEYLDKLLPELKSLKPSDSDGPVVRYFEGKEGLRAMSEEFYITDHKEKSLMFYSYDLLKECFSEEELKQMQSRRQKQNIKVKSIINDQKKELKTDAQKYIIQKKDYPITTDIAIFEDKVRMVPQKGSLMGVVIQHKEIANTLKTLFELAWRYLEITQKKKKG